jgi:hypothetical protein
VFSYIVKPGTNELWGNPTLAQDFFWLPPDTPFGNLTTKIFAVGQRLAHANVRLQECYTCWQNAMVAAMEHDASPEGVDTRILSCGNNFVQHQYAGEEAVAAIRRCADELVTLIWYLTQYDETGQFPEKIKVDMIDSFLLKSPELLNNKHDTFLEDLRRLSNAHKHSFVQSDAHIIGTDEPCVYLLSYPRNNRTKGCEFVVVPLHQLVDEFNAFLADCFERVRKLGEDIQVRQYDETV